MESVKGSIKLCHYSFVILMANLWSSGNRFPANQGYSRMKKELKAEKVIEINANGGWEMVLEDLRKLVEPWG